MLKTNKFKKFFGVDTFMNIHKKEFDDANKNTLLYKNKYNLIKSTFESALKKFDDKYFNFIYIDGFAHTGQEGGKTIIQWYKKLKVGGIIAGDDYHKDWPLVLWAVNDFAKQIKSKIFLTVSLKTNDYSNYPSWYLIKKHLKI